MTLSAWGVRGWSGLLIVVALGIASSHARADEAEGWAFKFTPGWYATRGAPPAVDLNLRASNGPQAVWIAHYRRGNEFAQSRAGHEYTAVLSDSLQLVSSLQVASRGFAGGSLTAQIGPGAVAREGHHGPYAIAGWGRTNGREYYNLNFDPNDALTLGAGWRSASGAQWSLFNVRDDRLGTGQRITHVVARWAPAAGQRLTLDLALKQGRADAQSDVVRGSIASLTWDIDQRFVRIAMDRKVNFSSTDQWRVAAGLRF